MNLAQRKKCPSKRLLANEILVKLTSAVLTLLFAFSSLASPHHECTKELNTFISAGTKATPPVSFQRKLPPLPSSEAEHASYANFLKERFGIPTEQIRWGKKYPLVIHGGEEKTFAPAADFANAISETVKYDAIIVGSGPGGLTSGAYLNEAGKKILILEREVNLGGLATGAERAGVRYGRGSAYFSEIDGDVYKIYKHLGLGSYKKDFSIPEPIDSYLWNGKFYEGLWENDEALQELPASFSLFKHYLEHADEIGLITSQPMEDSKATMILDQLTATEWVKQFPEKMKNLARKDPVAKAIYQRFLKDPKVDQADPMKDVIGLFELYCRSALGEHPDKISAAAFANFYISELNTRYTGNMGAGSVSDIIAKKLASKNDNVVIRTEAPVAKIRNTADGVEVFYTKDGKTFKAEASTAIFAAPLNVAPKVIEDYSKIAPKHFEAISSIKHRHYVVINVHVEGHPWKKTYDLWIRDDAKYSQAEITDVIDGRWVDFKGTKLQRNDDRGVLTIYLPLPESSLKEGLSDEKMSELAEKAIDSAKETIETIAKEVSDGQPVHVVAAEINRWPFSIHLVEPGHFQRAKILKEPVENIYFANNNMGVPAVEEAVYRGYEASQAVLKSLKTKSRDPDSAGKTKKMLKTPDKKIPIKPAPINEAVLNSP